MPRHETALSIQWVMYRFRFTAMARVDFYEHLQTIPFHFAIIVKFTSGEDLHTLCLGHARYLVVQRKGPEGKEGGCVTLHVGQASPVTSTFLVQRSCGKFWR